MANLSEQESWIDGIYQLETSDPVVAGPGGISNRQAEQLANRTAYLKKMQEATGDNLQMHLAASDPHPQYAPKDSPVLTGTPTAPTTAQTANNTQIATTAFVKSAVAALVNGSPTALDTLQKLGAALGNDPNFSTTVLNAIAGKLAKDQNGADIPDKALFTRNIGSGRAYSASIDFGGSAGEWTTTDFINFLREHGAFSHTYWMCRGSWIYAGNRTITDTECGHINLTGAVVEVFGYDAQMTIRVTTPSTTPLPDHIPNAQFTYVFNGTDYYPGWRRDYNTRNKPTAADVGALTDAQAAQKYVKTENPVLTGKPIAPTAGQESNDSQIATTAFVKAAVAALVNGSPAALDTLQELAAAMGNDPNFSTTMLNALAGKLAKDQNGADIPDKAQFLQNIGLGNVMMKGEFGWGGVAVPIPPNIDIYEFFSNGRPSGLYSAHQGGNTNVPVGSSGADSGKYKWELGLANNYGTLRYSSHNIPNSFFVNVLTNGVWGGWLREWNSGDFQLPLAKKFGGSGTSTGAVKNADASVAIPYSKILTKWSENQEIGSVSTLENGKWLSYISVRHRAGIDDGNQYGFVIFDDDMAMPSDKFYIRKQYAGDWRDPIELFHSGNLAPQTIGALPTSELVGMPQLFPGAVAPAGWLKCNGQLFDTAQYPVLASRYPSGFLPDLRGEFVRGWDDGRGVDTGRALLSAQGDAIRNITGRFNPGGHGTWADQGLFNTPEAWQSSASGNAIDSSIIVFDASKVVPTANENRPRNIAFNYIVRAA